MLISTFAGVFAKEAIDLPLNSIIQGIMKGQWKEEVLRLRGLPKEEYNAKKVNLTGVTFSGTFSKRLAAEIITYTKIICIDIDHIQADSINPLKTKLSEDPYVGFCFVSPSGNGLKILIKVNTEAEHHKSAFLHLQHYFQEKYDLAVDKACKDISRLCFVSYDEFAILKKADTFVVDLKYGEIEKLPEKKFSNSAPIFDTVKIFEVCRKWAEKHYQYTEGQRNAYIHALSCALNRCGVGLDDAVGILNMNFDLEEKEIRQAAKSAYFHNQAEHGKVTVNSYGSMDDQKIPAYDISYDDDLVMNDIKRITGLLYAHNVPKTEMLDVVAKVAKFYNSTKLIDIQRNPLISIVNDAVSTYQQNLEIESSRKSLRYMLAEELGSEIINFKIDERLIQTGFEDIDKALRGGLSPGNLYASIGTDTTFKSIFAQYLAFQAAAKQNRAVLYINAEMSAHQFYERLALMALNVNINEYIRLKTLTPDNMPEFIKALNFETQGNLFFVSGGDYTKESVMSTIDNIRIKTGKTVELVIGDGLSQMAWGKEKTEIGAAIQNAEICKEIAKESNEGKGVAFLALIHVAGANNKLFRATGLHVRGGVKVLANLDAFFQHSLLEDTSDPNPNDVRYIEGKFYLRLTDKRGNGGTVNSIIKVPDNLRLIVEEGDPSVYEVQKGQTSMQYE